MASRRTRAAEEENAMVTPPSFLCFRISRSHVFTTSVFSPFIFSR